MLAKKNGNSSLKNLKSERGKCLFMYRPTIKRKKTGVPVLSRKEIDIIGERLVQDFCPDAVITPQEIDIDLFVQDYLGVDMDYQYLSHCGVYLGMTVFNDTDKVPVFDPVNNRAEYISAKANTIIIDNSLLEKNQEHRYRFTTGHEGGHSYFHTEYFGYDPNQLTFADLLGDAVPAPMLQCRIDTKKAGTTNSKLWGDKEWMEWQANALSSAILMPKSMVLKLAEEVMNSSVNKRWLSMALVDKVSEVFNVSWEAATYRLKELGVIHKNEEVSENVFDAFLRSCCNL